MQNLLCHFAGILLHLPHSFAFMGFHLSYLNRVQLNQLLLFQPLFPAVMAACNTPVAQFGSQVYIEHIPFLIGMPFSIIEG
jgi:hypothetical protein